MVYLIRTTEHNIFSDDLNKNYMMKIQKRFSIKYFNVKEERLNEEKKTK